MQYPNNTDMAARRKLLIICGIALAVMIGLGLLLFFTNNKPSYTQPAMHKYTDPITGETVVSPGGKTPENYGVGANQAVILGLDALFKRGLSSDQVAYLKSCLVNQGYLHKYQRISVDTRHLNHVIDSATGESLYTLSFVGFKKIDDRQGTVYGLKLDTTDFTAMKVLVYPDTAFTGTPKTYVQGS